MTSYRLLFCDHMKTLIVNTDTQFSWIGSSSKDTRLCHKTMVRSACQCGTGIIQLLMPLASV